MTHLHCSAKDLKFKKNSLVIFIGPSKSGKSTTLSEVLQNPEYFFEEQPAKVLYVRKFTEKFHKEIEEKYGDRVEFVDWCYDKTRKTCLADLLKEKLSAEEEKFKIAILDDQQVDLEQEGFKNIDICSCLCNHTNSLIIISL